MSLPEGKVISGLDGGPLLRYETATESGLVTGEETLSRIQAISSQLALDLCGIHCASDKITLRVPASEREKVPSFFDWHIKNATGLRPEVIYASDEKVLIDEPYGEKLKVENPKGRILELEMARKVDKVEIRVWEASAGFEAQGTVRLWNGIHKTPVYWSRTKKKHAEQGAAHGLFKYLSGHFDLSVQPKEPKAPVQVTIDSRGKLNEMVQRKILSAFGYEELGKSGADHEAVFHMRAWADIPGKKRHMGPIVEARSKKDAQAKAALLLHDSISHLDIDPVKTTIIKPVSKEPVQEKMQRLRESMELQ
jgi:hypothetical protein